VNGDKQVGSCRTLIAHQLLLLLMLPTAAACWLRQDIELLKRRRRRRCSFYPQRDCCPGDGTATMLGPARLTTELKGNTDHRVWWSAE